MPAKAWVLRWALCFLLAGIVLPVYGAEETCSGPIVRPLAVVAWRMCSCSVRCWAHACRRVRCIIASAASRHPTGQCTTCTPPHTQFPALTCTYRLTCRSHCQGSKSHGRPMAASQPLAARLMPQTTANSRRWPWRRHWTLVHRCRSCMVGAPACLATGWFLWMHDAACTPSAASAPVSLMSPAVCTALALVHNLCPPRSAAGRLHALPRSTPAVRLKQLPTIIVTRRRAGARAAGHLQLC